MIAAVAEKVVSNLLKPNKMEKEQNINKPTKKAWSLLAINFAFQNTISWGGATWKLTEKDLEEIRELINPSDYKETGSKLWKWFYEKWDKKFITGQKMEYIGFEFMRNLDSYYA